MTYSETLAYLFTQLPMYQREGKAAYKADLSNTQRICDILDHPELQFKSVHIGGTNGKGSTSNYVASILQEAGLKVGLYTSPHLVDFRERIRINGQMIPEEEVVSFVAKYNTIFAEIKPSFFEWTVGLAFSYFAAQKVDIVVIEVGLGGRLDSTNVITPLVSAITNIGMDHMQFLGDNLESIAKEKAGIIKPGVPVVIGEYQEEIASLFEQLAKEKDAPLIFADQASPVFDFSDEINYQQKNIQTASQIAVTLRGQGYEISGGIIQKGINNMFQNMHLRGRWEVLQTKPKVIADTAHNQEGLTYTMAGIDTGTNHIYKLIQTDAKGTQFILTVKSFKPNQKLTQGNFAVDLNQYQKQGYYINTLY